MVSPCPHSSGRGVKVIPGLCRLCLGDITGFVDVSDRYVYIPGTLN